MRHEVHEKSEVVSRYETWEAEVEGFWVDIRKDEQSGFRVGISPKDWERYRIPLLSFSPKNVADFEKLAELLPAILAELAKQLRAEGLEDLRSKWDISTEEMKRMLHKHIQEAHDA